MHQISLKGRVAFVTGASKGIGVAIAEALAGAGADLALTARDEKGLHDTAELVRQSGSRAWVRSADLADADEARALAEATLGDLGRVDILVNNAGLVFPQRVLDVTMSQWHTTLNVNLLAPLVLTQIFAPGMIERGYGKIINVSSRAGISAGLEHAAYSASKAGLQLLTQTMAVELGPNNIQANCVAPTVIKTRMGKRAWSGPRRDAKLALIPAGRFGQPDEVASVILFLASPLSDYVNGTTIPVDGGEGA